MAGAQASMACGDALHALAIAGVGDAFASAPVDAVADGRHHHDGLVLRPARDGKPATDRKALDADFEVSALLHSCLSRAAA